MGWNRESLFFEGREQWQAVKLLSHLGLEVSTRTFSQILLGGLWSPPAPAPWQPDIEDRGKAVSIPWGQRGPGREGWCHFLQAPPMSNRSHVCDLILCRGAPSTSPVNCPSTMSFSKPITLTLTFFCLEAWLPCPE